MAGRIQKLGVVVGRKGVGKTFETNKGLIHYTNGNPAKLVPGRKVLILDFNDEFSDVKSIALEHIELFSIHPKIERRRVRPFKKNNQKMTLDEIAKSLFFILQKFSGGLLLIEDINAYIGDHMPDDLIGAICTNRHSDLDIIIHYQSIGRIQTKVWQNLNYIRFHKNTDSVARHQAKFVDKFEILSIAEKIVNKKYLTDPRFHLYVDTDEEKIRGKLSIKDIEDGIDDFISDNYQKYVSPLLKQRSKTGSKNYTPESASNFLKKKFKSEYF